MPRDQGRRDRSCRQPPDTSGSHSRASRRASGRRRAAVRSPRGRWPPALGRALTSQLDRMSSAAEQAILGGAQHPRRSLAAPRSPGTGPRSRSTTTAATTGGIRRPSGWVRGPKTRCRAGHTTASSAISLSLAANGCGNEASRASAESISVRSDEAGRSDTRRGCSTRGQSPRVARRVPRLAGGCPARAGPAYVVRPARSPGW